MTKARVSGRGDRIQEVSMASAGATNAPLVAFLGTGQMWRGAQVPAQMYTVVARNAESERPARLMIAGTSSGALAILGAGYAATLQTLPPARRAEQEANDQEFIRKLWRGFGEKTGGIKNFSYMATYPLRLLKWAFGGFRGDLPMPMPQKDALKWVFDQIDWERVYQSATQADVPIVTVGTKSHFSTRGAESLWSGMKMMGRGIAYLFSTDPGKQARLAEEHADHMIKAAQDIFEPRYFVTDAAMVEDLNATEEFRGKVTHLRDAQELRTAVEASVCIPFTFTLGFYGYQVGAERLFDGVWSDGAPVELPLALGARQVYVFNDSSRGDVRRREVQFNIVNSLLYQPTHWLRRRAENFDLRRITTALRGFEDRMHALRKPMPLRKIEADHGSPAGTIKVKGLPDDYPGDDVSNFLGRFYLSDPETIEEAIRAGQGHQVAEILAEIST